MLSSVRARGAHPVIPIFKTTDEQSLKSLAVCRAEAWGEQGTRASSESFLYAPINLSGARGIEPPYGFIDRNCQYVSFSRSGHAPPRPPPVPFSHLSGPEIFRQQMIPPRASRKSVFTFGALSAELRERMECSRQDSNLRPPPCKGMVCKLSTVGARGVAICSKISHIRLRA